MANDRSMRPKIPAIGHVRQPIALGHLCGACVARRTPSPPHAYFVVSAVFHYLGPAFAVLLFARVDVLGVAWLRIAVGGASIFAAVAAAVARAARAGRARAAAAARAGARRWR